MGYKVELSPDAPLVRLVLEGFWDGETFERFVAELAAAIQAAIPRHGRVDMLSDATAFDVQGPEVAAGFERLSAAGSNDVVRRAAIIVGSALGAVQARRLFTGGNARIFSDRAEAESWLSESPVQA